MSVIIVGGGMTGATLALALSHFSQNRIAIDLVEASELDAYQQSAFDDRTIALSARSYEILNQIGIWPSLATLSAPIKQIEVSDQGHYGTVYIDGADYQRDALGYVVTLRNIGVQLVDLLKRQENIRLHNSTKVVELYRDSDSITVSTDCGNKISGKLLVAADGSHSGIAKRLGIDYHCYDYQQIAVIANIETEMPHQWRAFERFTPHGPLAILPISEVRSAVVWCIAAERLATVQAWDDDTFLNQLQRAFGWRLGRLKCVGKRDYYPLSLRQAHKDISHRVVLVGNAAQTLHPIAGQGFNLALRDVATLAEIITRSPDPGSYGTLRQYTASRQPDKKRLIRLTDSLLRIFSNDFLPFEIARGVGLHIMDSSDFAKKWIIDRMSGYAK